MQALIHLAIERVCVFVLEFFGIIATGGERLTGLDVAFGDAAAVAGAVLTLGYEQILAEAAPAHAHVGYDHFGQLKHRHVAHGLHGIAVFNDQFVVLYGVDCGFIDIGKRIIFNQCVGSYPSQVFNLRAGECIFGSIGLIRYAYIECAFVGEIRHLCRRSVV